MVIAIIKAYRNEAERLLWVQSLRNNGLIYFIMHKNNMHAPKHKPLQEL